MNPIAKRDGLSIRKNLFIEISLQFLFIGIYIYKLIQNINNTINVLAYIISIILIIIYILYCVHVFRINKYPNHYLWFSFKILIYIIKFIVLGFDLYYFITDDFHSFKKLMKDFSTILSLMVILIQILFDLSKLFKYEFIKDYEDEDNYAGLAIMYFTINPIMSAYFIYTSISLIDDAKWIWITNLIIGIIFVFHSFMFFSKITITNLVIILATIISIVDTMYITIYLDYSDKPVLVGMYYVISVILILVSLHNVRSGHKFIYKRGEEPNRYKSIDG